MAVQGAVQATIAYKEESTFGTPAGAASAQYLRRVSSSLSGKKGAFASNEVRVDQQVSDLRHGGRSVGGGIEGELSIVGTGLNYEPLLQALLRGSAWTAGVTAGPADFATSVTVATAGSTSTLTFVGAGNLLTKGFRIGDVVRLTGFTNPANNGKNLRVTAVSSLVLTVTPAITATAAQAAGWSVAVQGKKLLVGTTKKSFTLEQSFGDAAVFERFTGCRVNGANINVQPNGMASIGFDFMGQDFLNNGVGYFTTPTAETVGGNLTGVDGYIRVNGVDMGVVTSLQVNVSNNLSMPPVVGSVLAPDIFYGRMVVTGSLTVMLDSITMLQAFDQETEFDVTVLLEAAGTDPQDFLAINMQRVKATAGDHQLGPDGAVVVQLPFQALLASGTGKDASTIVLQRSTTN